MLAELAAARASWFVIILICPPRTGCLR